MTQHDYDYDLLRRQECTSVAANIFNLDLKVDSFICDDVETGEDSYAVLFKSNGDKYALLINKSDKSQTLMDVYKTLRNMGLVATAIFPPRGDDSYFHRQAMIKLKETYPAYRNLSMNDVYLGNVEYNPALVKITEINDGVIRRFDKIDSSWRELLVQSYGEVGAVYG